MNTNSASGVDVWDYRLIKQLVLKSGKNNNDTALINGIIQLVKSMLKGTMNPNVGHFWSLTKTIFIPKTYNADGTVDAWRPIGITNAWYRIAGKIIASKLKMRVGNMLCSRYKQFGIGINDGCSIAGKIVKQYLSNEDNAAVATIDISNAFNETDHKLILEGISKLAPELENIFKYIYYLNQPGLVAQGKQVGTVSQGILQGDSLSMLYFNIGFSVVLESLTNELTISPCI